MKEAKRRLQKKKSEERQGWSCQRDARKRQCEHIKTKVNRRDGWPGASKKQCKNLVEGWVSDSSVRIHAKRATKSLKSLARHATAAFSTLDLQKKEKYSSKGTM